jgi:hypothetical protein
LQLWLHHRPFIIRNAHLLSQIIQCRRPIPAATSTPSRTATTAAPKSTRPATTSPPSKTARPAGTRTSSKATGPSRSAAATASKSAGGK